MGKKKVGRRYRHRTRFDDVKRSMSWWGAPVLRGMEVSTLLYSCIDEDEPLDGIGG